MKKKIIGIFVCMLFIGTMLIPVTGTMMMSSSVERNNRSLDYYDPINSVGSELEWMIAGKAIRCLRAYRIYVPSSYDGSNPVPFVLVIHGARTFGKEFKFTNLMYHYQDTFFENYTKFCEKAEEEGFLAVFPKAIPIYKNNQWILLPIAPHNPDAVNSIFVDDVGFVDDLIDKIQNKYNIDANRIYITGLSSGADFAYYYACARSDTIAAFAPVAGEIAKKNADEDEYTYPPDPTDPISAIVFHGTKDPNYPWNGDQWGCGVNASIEFLVEHNGCDTEPTVYESESGKIVRYTYSNGTDGTEIILYKTVGGGHWWPGDGLLDNINEISATELIWAFFEAHPKQ